MSTNPNTGRQNTQRDKAVAIEISELIRERDELQDQNRELLDQVQCLQWDLGALQQQHDLCPPQAAARRR